MTSPRRRRAARARPGRLRRQPHPRGRRRGLGPHPRDYSYRLPQKIKRAALKSALSDRASHERISVVEDFTMDAPKTSRMAELLKGLSLAGRHTLVVLDREDDNIYKSARNLQGVRVLRSHELNAYTILWADNLVFTQKALSGAEEVFGS
mgnify:CR=1 FL=1